MEKYSAKSIQILEGLEAIRKRPGMYIGSIGKKGLHHLAWEIIDNSIDETMAGYTNRISITITKDGFLEVIDNGRGIPVEKHKKTNKSSVETVLTNLHAGGKFNADTYKVSGGLHGVGASVVNALSKQFEIWVYREGKIWYQKYINGGQALEPLKEIGQINITGTRIKFLPDETILETIVFDFETINDRLKQLAYLNKGLTIVFEDQRITKKVEYCFKNGLLEYINELNQNKDVINKDIIYIDKEINKINLEVALQYNAGYQNNVISFANNIATIEHGTHEQGFLDALTRVLNWYAQEIKIFKNDEKKITREDVKEGLTVIISIWHPDPIFEGQTKSKLGNSDARKITNKIASIALEKFLLEKPEQAKMIIEKSLLAQKARIAAENARLVTRKTSIFDIGALPGKLADCASKNAAMSELYIVEGDSAGGSAKMGRNREYQAILPLRGKVINSEKARIDKIFANEEILMIIKALGTSAGEEFDLNKIRYHKIIIMTDADVDGAHIRTLLLTFFYRHLKPIIEYGFLYIAQPPLYKISYGRKAVYAYDDKQKQDILKQLKPEQKYQIQRYKGLGEMDAQQLWETTMSPEQRKMLQVQITDFAAADQTFSTLMGENVWPRKEFINQNAKYVKNIDT